MDTTHHLEIDAEAPPPPQARFANNYVSTQAQEFTMSAFVPAGLTEAVVVLSFLEQKIVPVIDGSAHGVRGEAEVTATVVLTKQMFREICGLGDVLLSQVAGIEKLHADGQSTKQP